MDSLLILISNSPILISSCPQVTPIYQKGKNTICGSLTKLPIKSAVSLQKALQGSETEMRELLEVMKQSYIFADEGSLICHPGKSKIFFTKS